MARRLPAGSKSARSARFGPVARRAWPVLLMAYERWKDLPEEDKERYKARGRAGFERGRAAVEQARRRQGGRRIR